MTLTEMRRAWVQIASNHAVVAKAPEDAGIEVDCESIAEDIQAIPLSSVEVLKSKY